MFVGFKKMEYNYLTIKEKVALVEKRSFEGMALITDKKLVKTYNLYDFVRDYIQGWKQQLGFSPNIRLLNHTEMGPSIAVKGDPALTRLLMDIPVYNTLMREVQRKNGILKPVVIDLFRHIDTEGGRHVAVRVRCETVGMTPFERRALHLLAEAAGSILTGYQSISEGRIECVFSIPVADGSIL